METPARIHRDISQDLVVIGVRVLDDAYMNWVATEVESEHALRAWFEATAANHGAAYVAYQGAVDREEAAARDLQRLCELIQPQPEIPAGESF
jgi:hypothetical protein